LQQRTRIGSTVLYHEERAKPLPNSRGRFLNVKYGTYRILSQRNTIITTRSCSEFIPENTKSEDDEQLTIVAPNANDHPPAAPPPEAAAAPAAVEVAPANAQDVIGEDQKEDVEPDPPHLRRSARVPARPSRLGFDELYVMQAEEVPHESFVKHMLMLTISIDIRFWNF
jgi:hypothetical protein